MVEQNRPNVPIIIAVTTKISKALATCEGEMPPKKKTRLKSGTEAAIRSSALAMPATNFPETSDREESREHNNRSKVCRSFSPLIVVEVKAGVINMIRK